MKFSILIPTHNRLDLLKQCLDAVFAQTEKPDEIIVSDDASTDGTADFLETCVRFHQITFYIQEKNLNMVGNKNFLANKANGDVLCFIDDDFILDREWLFHIKKAFENNQELTVAGGRTIQDGYRMEEKALFFPMNTLSAVRSFLKMYAHISVPYFFTKTEHKGKGGMQVVRGNNMAIRRDFFIRRSEKLVDVGEDTILCLEAHQKGRGVAIIPEAYGYEKTGGRLGVCGGPYFFYRMVRNWIYIQRAYQLHRGLLKSLLFFMMLFWICVLSIFLSFKNIRYIMGIFAIFDRRLSQ